MLKHYPSLILVLACCVLAPLASAAEKPGVAEKPGDASKPYTVTVKDTKVGIKMVPIPGGVFTMGSPENEADRNDDEGPQVQVKIEPFWMGAHEITWDDMMAHSKLYDKLKLAGVPKLSNDKYADAVSIPTNIWDQDALPIYRALGWGGQKDGGRYPVASCTQLLAKQYCKWLSRKTGHFYRLPTEAEWEYAARAGTTTAYHFGDDPSKLKEYAWYFDNTEYEDPDRGIDGAGYRRVGLKKPNPWGLYDMHGNVAEWTMDQYDEKHYQSLKGKPVSWAKALRWPTKVYPRVIRGGHYDADAQDCRSASRLASHSEFGERDPQVPKSNWWHSDAFHVGFRIVRPVTPPSKELQNKYWAVDNDYEREALKETKQLRIEVKEKTSP